MQQEDFKPVIVSHNSQQKPLKVAKPARNELSDPANPYCVYFNPEAAEEVFKQKKNELEALQQKTDENPPEPGLGFEIVKHDYSKENFNRNEQNVNTKRNHKEKNKRSNESMRMTNAEQKQKKAFPGPRRTKKIPLKNNTKSDSINIDDCSDALKNKAKISAPVESSVTTKSTTRKRANNNPNQKTSSHGNSNSSINMKNDGSNTKRNKNKPKLYITLG